MLKIENYVNMQPATPVTILYLFVTDGAETEVGDWDVKGEEENDKEGGRDWDSMGGS